MEQNPNDPQSPENFISRKREEFKESTFNIERSLTDIEERIQQILEVCQEGENFGDIKEKYEQNRNDLNQIKETAKRIRENN
jgi:hypothetical protein